MSEVLFRCRINGRARSKKNSKQIFRNRKSGKPFITSSSEYKKWSAFAAGYIARAKKIDTIDYPVNLVLRCHYINKKHQQDLDNIIASVSDVLEDCDVIKNDNLFYSYDGSRKIYDAETDFIEIEITKLIV